MKGSWGPPWHPGGWRHQHHQHHQHRRRWRENVRHFTGAHLRRRLFLWFGATIFLTIFVMGGVGRLTGGDRPRGVFFLALPALALWVLSGKIARRIARPLDELVQVSTEIGRGNLRARAELACGGFDETAILARSINDMAGRIERQIGDQRELLAGVSHELRTPLARLRVLLDIARDQGTTPRTWDELERELLEMDRLVGELLASARLDFQALIPKPLDAVDAAAHALERAGLPADKLIPESATARFAGDPTLVGRALANLLHNASKHGGGLDRLRVGTRPGFVTFEVLDRGPGFPPELLENLFRPFTPGSPSLGLGLALVARIARAHGGSVRASNREAGGAQLVLELAESPPPAPEG